MLDNTKLLITNQDLINRLGNHPDFIVCRPKNNYYHSLCHKDFGKKFSLDFRNAKQNKIIVGYTHLEINISPHYHYNRYLHNGNDLTPFDCITTIQKILQYIGIETKEYQYLKVVNIEFGLNFIPETDVKDLINGIYFYKKTNFDNSQFPYFKKTNATTYKQIKAYAKGLQFLEYTQYGINQNTFRFEIKSKQAKNIKKYGIYTALDLIKPEIYLNLSQQIINEWDNCLLTNGNPDLTDLNNHDKQFIQNANKFDFWNDLIEKKHRNTFVLKKEKYYNILDTKNNLHHAIKLQIIDKLFQFGKCANSTQENPIKSENPHFENISQNRINLEYAHLTHCKVTKLDISMQKKGSKYLCFTGLKYYRENDPKTYKMLEKKYLSAKMQSRPLEDQIYYIAHNIRNNKTNPKHNPKYSRQRFEQRNYHKDQLQFNFN